MREGVWPQSPSGEAWCTEDSRCKGPGAPTVTEGQQDLLKQNWGGQIFEKLRICSMPQFVRFIHNLRPLKKDPDVVVTDLRFGTIPVKLYQPKSSICTPRPGIIYFHGGGTMMGSLKTHHGICCLLSKKSDSVVLAVGYRLLPKFKFPVPLRDCTVATIHFLKSLKAYGVDPARVVVCGDSVGGGVAAVICQQLVDHPELPRIRAQILICAFLQSIDFQLPSCQQNSEVPLLQWNTLFYCISCFLDFSPSWEDTIRKNAHLPASVWEKYRKWLGPENIPERFKKTGYRAVPPAPLNEDAYLETNIILDSKCSPLIAEDHIISRLPEACIVSCEYDAIRDHSLLYKKRLEDLGVPVTWCHLEDGFHGVLNTIDLGWLYFPSSMRIMNVLVHFIKGL
ncbi:arylacetamide deacetylase-like 3 isoform X2 [Nycticebus coucang]|uniref:arylacetamide deacetylase-like 3 isoform X2 n=1 Tax=Nycticebus coucang TaxID=9470 RepID=UPI00234C1709|nr:arylacetamide deacetylase-like 3 isoform X2 [Nycticebus coucang]